MLYHRDYENYEEYLAHQARKLDVSIKRARFSHAKFSTFKDRCVEIQFGPIQSYFPEGGRVLCAAARLGMEVAALRELGFDAIGIDANPGPRQNKDDPLVVKGDFHNMDFDDCAFDAVYSNSIDHCYRIELLSEEFARVLVPGGRLILHIPHLNRDSRQALVKGVNKYESTMYDTLEDIQDGLKQFELIEYYESDLYKKIAAIYDKIEEK